MASRAQLAPGPREQAPCPRVCYPDRAITVVGLLFTNSSQFLRPFPSSGDVNPSAQELSCCVTSEDRLWQHRWQQQLQCSLPACLCCTSRVGSHTWEAWVPLEIIPYCPKSIVLPRKYSSSYTVFNYSYVQDAAPCTLILVLWDVHFYSESLQLWT